MSSIPTYMKRHDTSHAQYPQPRRLYAVKLFDEVNLADLQDAVNTFLVELSEKGVEEGWEPHIVDIQFEYFATTGGPPQDHWFAKVLIFAAGNLDNAPTTWFEV